MRHKDQICHDCRFWDAKDYIVPGYGRCRANKRMIRNQDDKCDCDKFEEREDE